MKYVLFGAGYFCGEAIKEYGKENVICIWDNDSNKDGTVFSGVPVLKFDKRKSIEEDYKVILCSIHYGEIIDQLEQEGINDYEIYHSIIIRHSYYNPHILIDNPYVNEDRDLDEWKWIENNTGESKRKSINRKVEQFVREQHLFHHVEIETVNRCNGKCSFCPVNTENEKRPFKKMDEKLFKKIIDELAGMNYSGRLALFSNNEPLIDTRIVDFHKYAREKLPHARMHLYTNGTLLTQEVFEQLVSYLDELIIDNYDENLELIPASKMVQKYAEKHPEIVEKVTIVLRKPNEILTSRGGDAPNRTQVKIASKVSCVWPFQQLIIRPDGKVSLCCNDPLGKTTLGDASVESLTDIWFGAEYENVRRIIREGRECFDHCKNCDTFAID